MDDSLGRLSPDGKLRNFTRSDGLLWNDTNCGAFWQESDGTLLIGTSHGLARYDPRQEELPRTPPTVVLTSAEFAGDDSIAKVNPQVPYDEGWFSVQFAAMTFRDPDQVRCRYRLRGLERDFSATSLREVRYSALQPGHYTFEVACGSPDVGWSPKPAQYSFTILAPWWSTPWARIGGIALIGLLILALIRFRTRRLESDRRRLEAAVEERSSELARLNRELQEASLTDPLTGIRNRRFFYTTIAADANQATRAYFADSGSYSRDHRDLIFYLIDLDHFKLINDAYGHDAGDEVLVECSRRLGLIVRKSDFLIRWGGEEFLIVCRAAERKDAGVVAEKILSAIAEEPFTIAGGKKVNRTCSVGWAPFPWDPALAPLTVDEVLKMADRGLYRAKDRGRNHAIGMLPMEYSEVPVGAGEAEAAEESGVSAREVVLPGPGW
jgi:diguanylate cyclase (GGDEF)-like protein